MYFSFLTCDIHVTFVSLRYYLKIWDKKTNILHHRLELIIIKFHSALRILVGTFHNNAMKSVLFHLTSDETEAHGV